MNPLPEPCPFLDSCNTRSLRLETKVSWSVIATNRGETAGRTSQASGWCWNQSCAGKLICFQTGPTWPHLGALASSGLPWSLSPFRGWIRRKGSEKREGDAAKPGQMPKQPDCVRAVGSPGQGGGGRRKWAGPEGGVSPALRYGVNSYWLSATRDFCLSQDPAPNSGSSYSSSQHYRGIHYSRLPCRSLATTSSFRQG